VTQQLRMCCEVWEGPSSRYSATTKYRSLQNQPRRVRSARWESQDQEQAMRMEVLSVCNAGSRCPRANWKKRGEKYLWLGERTLVAVVAITSR
jgi:hypothetical protein